MGTQSMKARREHRPPRSRQEDADCSIRLAARIEDLELRIKLLEARVRAFTAERRMLASEESAKPGRKGRRTRPRPRCPGCMLELPPGKRGETCVWCGFRFEAVGG